MSVKSEWPLGALCGIVGGIGAAIVGVALSMVWTTGWGKDLFAPGATMMTVALTAYIAAQSVVKWQEQRRRDREKAEFAHREAVYEQLATFMLRTFVSRDDGPDARLARLVVDSELRAKAALWGSSTTIETLAYWQTLMSTVLDNHELYSGGHTSIDDVERRFLRDAFGRALLSMRLDLAPATGQMQVSRESILNSIFNE